MLKLGACATSDFRYAMTSEYSKSTDFSSNKDDVNAEIRRLSECIAETQVAIRSSQIKLDGLEQKLAVFLERYYQEVGGLFEQWRRLNGTMAQACSANNNEPEIPAVTHSKAPVSHEKGLKTLYRKLAKAHHPDKSGADKLFKHINLAFKEKNLSELIRLEQDLMDAEDFANETPVQKLLRLSDKYDATMQELGTLQHHIHALENSEAYMLRHRVISATIRGHSVVDEIKDELQYKIALRRKELVV